MTETVIPQAAYVVDTIERNLKIEGPDEQGDTLVVVSEDGREAGLYIDAHGVSVLRRALSEPTESAPPADEPFDLDWNRSAAAAAIHFEKEISFSYDKGEGVIEQRRLFPKASYDAPNGTVIMGDDPDRNDVRAFRLDRIQGEVVIR